MILLKNSLLFLHGSPGEVSTLSTHWLRTAITSAASKAGYPGWWLADDLVAGISVYLRDGYAGPLIDQPHLERVIRGVLCDVGYGEVAVFFRTKIPTQRISLTHCVRGLKQNDRAEFFDELAERILELQSVDVAHIHFSDLQACVRNLLRIPASPRGDNDDCLALEVVAFVREKVLALFQRQEVWCSVT